VQLQRDRPIEHGGVILMEPTDLAFGERQCAVLDPWGHYWTFSQTIRLVAVCRRPIFVDARWIADVTSDSASGSVEIRWVVSLGVRGG
jgi:hypothetical protein